jgi:glycosyltransferase involved in cell wall biosynthesis
MNQLVSIILPTYNGADRIASAIQSVLEQKYQQWELLVIDDGSFDENKTAAALSPFLSDPRIIYLKNTQNLGIQKTLNKGLAQAKGQYIARLDDDDLWVDQDKLQKQVVFLNTHPDHVLIGTGVILVDETGKELLRYLLPENDTAIRNTLLGKNCFIHSSVLFKKSAAIEVGSYDESRAILHLEDYDLWLKLGTVGKLANLPLYATMFTLRKESLSSKNRIDQMKKSFYIIKKYKKQYPGYLRSLIRAASRLIVYGYILPFPFKTYVYRTKKKSCA